ncbi:hypothetical protein [Streptomyces buecherae]|uniref:Uncharacterized protein n=1 Tax=Streptomyces buecherae TaxID=2763006 RepID=A0A7H8N6S2_9ACTN|nr:hypothetical protein [Streptomyces buecherae]QKW50227.1 hypothetical protein HUT08_12505 [Streptomyces buecherae]
MGDVFDKVTWWGDGSTSGPAVIQPMDTPILAWRGNQNSRNITVANATGPPGQLAGTVLRKTVLADSSPYAPALAGGLLADIHGQMAWVDISAGQRLHVATLEIETRTFTFTGRLAGRTLVSDGVLSGRSAPTLAGSSRAFPQVGVVDQQGNQVVANESSPLVFSALATLSWVGATRGPVRRFSLSDVPGGRFLWAWTASDGFLRFAFTTSPTPSGETPAVVRSAQQSIAQPSVTSYRGGAHVGWTGVDGTGLLNVAALDLGRLGNGADPIASVNILNERGIGAPTLVGMAPTANVRTHRLAIFWAGTDGQGTLNGGIVYRE